jgi:hypothetical protein
MEHLKARRVPGVRIPLSPPFFMSFYPQEYAKVTKRFKKSIWKNNMKKDSPGRFEA